MQFLPKIDFPGYKLKDEVVWNVIGLLIFAISGILINTVGTKPDFVVLYPTGIRS